MPHSALLAEDIPPPALATGPASDDRLARCLLCQAQGAFQKWPEGFAGFRAVFACEGAGQPVRGRVTVAPRGHVDVECHDDVVRTRLRDMLAAMAIDRTPRFFDEGDGRFPVCFADGDDTSPCRTVHVHARLGAIRYHIDPTPRVLAIERVAHGLRAVTAHKAFMRTTPGRVLPTETVTATWDLATGTLLRSESICDSHRRVDHVWLPLARRISDSSDGPPLALSLHDHQLI
jgi:hypothetical protein